MNLDRKHLMSIFGYDKSTGDLVWKKRKPSDFVRPSYYAYWDKRYSGKVAGATCTTLSGVKYILVCVNNKRYLAHRVIWLIVHGEQPNIMDHIDGNGINNRIANLRNVNRELNGKNTKLNRLNKSGHHGVYWNENRNKWVVFIGINKKKRYIGGYSKKSAAIKARKEAEKENGYHINHGRI